MDKILLVDDERLIYDIIIRLLDNKDYELAYAKKGEEALTKIRNENFNLLILDIKLPDINGIELLKKIRELDVKSEVIVVTAYGYVDNAVKAMKMGAYDYIEKPFDNQKLSITIDKAIESYHLKEEVSELKKQIDETLHLKEKMGESKQIKRVLQQIDMVANKNVTVFFEGETGAGKDLAAKILHKKSNRRDGPFVAVDCGAIPETLFESELFGHVKGAFTNATSNKSGKFEQADGGILFLDEITNLPLNLQPKFLRAIQEREIYRLGSSKPCKVDVRIVVATNKNIKEEIENNNFRKDLFFRLHEFKIYIPNLKERRSDIPTIANYFLKETNATFDESIKGISPEAMDKLLKYPWPGNVRELRNVIKRAVIHCDDDLIQPHHLKFISDEEVIEDENWRDSFFEKIDFSNSSLEDMLKRAEEIIIDEAIERADGTKVKAAKMLNISRWSIYRKTSPKDKD